MGRHPLADLYVREIARAPALASMAELETALSEALRDARRRWPAIALSDEAFVRHLAAHIGPEAAEDTLVARVREAAASDVLLVAACLVGDRAALRALDTQVLGPTVAAVSQTYRTLDRDELTQVVRERVLVGKGDERPKIASYAGRSPLSAWLHVVAVRAALTMLRRRKPTERLDQEDSDTAIAELVADDLELGHVRSEYAAEFKASFHAALAGLSTEDRTLLRLSALEGLSIDELGRLHGVHRATAARWLVRIRDALREATRTELKARLRLGETEVESIVGLLLSRLDVSLARVLSELDDGSKGPTNG